MSLLFRLALMFTSGRFSDSNPVAHPISICSPYSCSVSLSAALLCRLLLRIMFPFILFFFLHHIYDFLLPLSILLCSLSKPFALPLPFICIFLFFFLCWVIFFSFLCLSPLSPPFLSRVLLFSLPFSPSLSPKHFIRNILCRVSMMKHQLNSAYEIFSRLNFLNFFSSF